MPAAAPDADEGQGLGGRSLQVLVEGLACHLGDRYAPALGLALDILGKVVGQADSGAPHTLIVAPQSVPALDFMSMPLACYGQSMSAIQVKNVPDELHDRLRVRARLEGRNLSDYVLEVLRRDLRMPSTREWLERLEQDEPVSTVTSQDIANAVHEARTERYEQIVGRALADRD